jgi:hypothetical protein
MKGGAKRQRRYRKRLRNSELALAFDIPLDLVDELVRVDFLAPAEKTNPAQIAKAMLGLSITALMAGISKQPDKSQVVWAFGPEAVTMLQTAKLLPLKGWRPLEALEAALFAAYAALSHGLQGDK